MPAISSQLIVKEMKGVEDKTIAEAMAQYLLGIIVDLEPEKAMSDLIKNGAKPSLPFLIYETTALNGSPDDDVLVDGHNVKLKSVAYKNMTHIKDLCRNKTIYPDAFVQKCFEGMPLRSVFKNTLALPLLCTMLGPNFWVKKTYSDKVRWPTTDAPFVIVDVILSLEFSMKPHTPRADVLRLWHDAADVEVETGRRVGHGPNLHIITWPSSVQYQSAMMPLVYDDEEW